MPVLLVAIALLGLAIGSFLNVVIHRLPAGISLSHPPSQCPACDHRIRPHHNVPVLGWLLLRGRCADCGGSISARYPLVELATGLVFLGLAAQLAHLRQLPALPAFLYFAAIGISLTMIDVDLHRLPNSIVLPSYPALALMLTLAAAFSDSPAALVRAGIGGAALFAIYFVIAFAYPTGMGFGDVKLAGLIGMMLGYLSFQNLLVGGFGAFLLGGVFGLVLIAVRRGSRKSQLPFGPFMIVAALIVIFAGQPISDLYLRLVLAT